MRPKTEQSPWVISLYSIGAILLPILINLGLSPAQAREVVSCGFLTQKCYNHCNTKDGVSKDSCITACRRIARIAIKTGTFSWETKPEEQCTK